MKRNFVGFLTIGLLAISSQLQAAEVDSHKIFSSISNGAMEHHQVIKNETKNLYQNLFGKIQSQGMTTLDKKEIPLTVEVKEGGTGALSHLKFTAFAENDDEKSNIKIVFNAKGTVAPPVTKDTADFAKTNQNGLHDGNYLEFTILHELAHVQHDKMGYMSSNITKSMTPNELSFIKDQQEKEYHKSIDGRHQEQTADMLAAVWHLKNNNFSQESIDTVKAFKDNRAKDLENIQSKNGKSVISYDTAPGLTFVLDNLEIIKNLKGSEVLSFVSDSSSQLTKDFTQKTIAELSQSNKFAGNFTNLEKMRTGTSPSIEKTSSMKMG